MDKQLPLAPTKAMCRAGSKIRINGDYGALHLFHDESAEVWEAMLSTALQDRAYSLALAQQLAAAHGYVCVPKPDDDIRREAAWLIERHGTYATCIGPHPSWSTDPWRAHRYAAKREAQDARLNISANDARDESRVVEHLFIYDDGGAAPGAKP